MKVNDIKTWLDKCQRACFGIRLPNGWLGRPFDNQHRLDNFIIEDDKLTLQFDEGRELIIYGYQDFHFEVDQANYNIVKIDSFSKVDLVWFPYDKTINDKTIQTFNEGELVLYGQYFK